MDFDGSFTGTGIADFMLGFLSETTIARPNTHYSNSTRVGLYVTDTWRTTQNLTLSAGLRWEPTIPQWAGPSTTSTATGFYRASRAPVFANAPAGLYYPGDPGFPDKGTNARWAQFAPRLGLAWDVTGDGRTSVRASYGYSYVFTPGYYRLVYSGAAPWGSRTTLTNPPGGLDDPWKDIPGGNIFPYELSLDSPFPRAGGLYYSQPYDLRTASTNAWNLSLQRQLGEDWLVSGSYMGTNIIHTWPNKSVNPAVYFPGRADADGNCFAQGFTFSTRAGATCSSTRNTDARRRLGLEDPEGRNSGMWLKPTMGVLRFITACCFPCSAAPPPA